MITVSKANDVIVPTLQTATPELGHRTILRLFATDQNLSEPMAMKCQMKCFHGDTLTDRPMAVGG